MDLANQLSLTKGDAVANGLGLVELKFLAEGRSPRGALAGLRGSGSYDFDDFRLLGLTPSAFNQALKKTRDGTGITAAFDALRGGEGLFFGKIGGTITIANGEAAFLPFAITTPEADVKVTTMAELALGEIDADISVALKGQADLPPMRFSYAGPPSALARSEDNSELATKLGVTIMQHGIDELERLQREQKRLAALEEKQRIDDEARLAAYYAQRDELILRKRELKVHAEMRVIEAERLRVKLEAERAANAEISKGELKQRTRELRVFRRLSRLSSATPKPRPETPARVAVQPVPAPASRGSVVLVQPEGVPAVISPELGAAPSQ